MHMDAPTPHAAIGGHGGRDEPAGHHETCCDPIRRSLLVPYALATCCATEADAFEAQLLACEACFQDLKALDRAGVLIRAHLRQRGEV